MVAGLSWPSLREFQKTRIPRFFTGVSGQPTHKPQLPGRFDRRDLAGQIAGLGSFRIPRRMRRRVFPDPLNSRQIPESETAGLHIGSQVSSSPGKPRQTAREIRDCRTDGIKSRVGAAGFEPTASSSRTRRATRLRYAPTSWRCSGRFLCPRPWAAQGNSPPLRVLRGGLHRRWRGGRRARWARPWHRRRGCIPRGASTECRRVRKRSIRRG